jgi:hypothetical protein
MSSHFFEQVWFIFTFIFSKIIIIHLVWVWIVKSYTKFNKSYRNYTTKIYQIFWSNLTEDLGQK